MWDEQVQLKTHQNRSKIMLVNCEASAVWNSQFAFCILFKQETLRWESRKGSNNELPERKTEPQIQN